MTGKTLDFQYVSKLEYSDYNNFCMVMIEDIKKHCVKNQSYFPFSFFFMIVSTIFSILNGQFLQYCVPLQTYFLVKSNALLHRVELKFMTAIYNRLLYYAFLLTIIITWMCVVALKTFQISMILIIIKKEVEDNELSNVSSANILISM